MADYHGKEPGREKKIQITKKEWSYIDKTKVKSLEFGCKARSF